MAIKAPMVIDGAVRSVARIKPAEAAGLAPGMSRYYITLDVAALIRGGDAIPPRVGYVLDAPANAVPRKKQRVLVFARPVATMPDQVQLVENNGQLAWSPTTEATVRSLAQDVASTKSPPAITGIGNAFHSPGTLPGEGETQIFLTTRGGPVSLSITRRQNESPTWTVALSEVVGDALPPPRRNTFLWYRLACGLPAAVPNSLLAQLEPGDAAAVREDYAFVQSQLGPCHAS
ncbi:MAG: hypothetical protein J0I47_06035 [Sphingomonas sp.]|nr:hypothetical protein [Sphingomonas sp.]